jgi:hypothetical protein
MKNYLKDPTKVCLAFVLMAFCLTSAFAQNDRALAVLAKAKEAIGGEAKIKAVSSLSTKIKFRHLPPFPDAPEMTGELEFNLLLPDKFMKAETIEHPGAMAGGMGSSTMIEVLNGEQFWVDAKSNGPGMMMFRASAGPSELQALHLRELRQEFARQLLLFLLTAPESLPLEWSYAGEAEAEDGRADALNVRSSDGFAARLFLDKQTHLPLMLSYRTKMPVMGRAISVGGAPPKGDVMIGAPRVQIKGQGIKEFGVASGFDETPKEIEVQIRLSEYRDVDGLKLPHRFSRTMDDKIDQEWEVVNYLINPPLQAEQFEQKQKR